MRSSASHDLPERRPLLSLPRVRGFRVAAGAQVREFWHELEAATNARQAALFAALNAQLEVLARRIEAVVGDALDVALEPAALAIAPPTPEQFHADLRELFSTGARRSGPALTSIR